MTAKPRYYHHGRSPAAWIGSLIAAIGFVIGTVAAFTWPNWTLVYVSAGVLLLSLIVGGVMKKMGYGQG